MIKYQDGFDDKKIIVSKFMSKAIVRVLLVVLIVGNQNIIKNDLINIEFYLSKSWD